jgi:ribosomal protein S12 methylthiotransferase
VLRLLDLHANLNLANVRTPPYIAVAMAKTVYLAQLGCPKNEVDGEHLIGALRRAGYTTIDSPKGADVLLVNTCGFIAPAKKESIERILELAQYKNGNGTRLLVAGCLAQRYPKQLLADIPEIDALVGIDRIDDVVRAARGEATGNCFVTRPDQAYHEYDAPRAVSTRPWAYLKISDGCDNACAFCAIPQFRGKNRSRAMEDILNEAERLASEGVRELVVVAQDTTSYGVDRYGTPRLAELLVRLGQTPGIQWVRLMYAFPYFVDESLIDVICHAPNVVRYLDMPIQHINHGMLMQMNRRLGSAETIALLERFRIENPDVALRTSVVVGHPGESANAFGQLADFIADFEFDRLGVFVYSLEEGTKAARMEPKVDEATAEMRRRMLLDIQDDVLARRQDARIGRTLDVLVESELDGALYGRSEADAPEVDCGARIEGRARIGDIVRGRCVGIEGVDLVVSTEGA